MAKIFLLEDDKILTKGLTLALEKEGHDMVCACNYTEGMMLQRHEHPDIFILDINLPDRSGLDFCEELRKTSDAPIIFLTANDTEDDMLTGFKAGCDDYLAKPFSTDILKERINAVLRRSVRTESEKFIYKDLTVNFDKKQVKLCDKDIKLTAKEYKLLTYMIKNRGRVVTRNMLIENLWDIDGDFIDENTLSVNIRRLRQKIEDDPKDPEYINTVFGVGYTFGE